MGADRLCFMSSAYLCQPDELAAALGDPALVVIDCRFVLGAESAGVAAYLEAHVPGARYAHLERDLSGPPTTDRGRHPLPPPSRMAAVFARLGIGSRHAVVVYDDAGGMVAARLWWMLRYCGHEQVRLLDGGWQAWAGAGHAVGCGNETWAAETFSAVPRCGRLVQVNEVEKALDAARPLALLDAREAVRFRGEQEPIDPVAGHIPGAVNHCWRNNLADDGRFLPPVALREHLTAACGQVPDAEVTHYCGSGVSACHNVLAQCIAGLPEPRLYCGSWSEWCRDEGRRVMMGDGSTP